MTDLPLPPHHAPERVGEIYRVDYASRAAEARAWAERHAIAPATCDRRRVGLLLIDLQNTFCTPGFELYVGGPTGDGAVADSRRLIDFLYRNLGAITRIVATLDSHTAHQLFHPALLVDADGTPPPPMTPITADDVAAGRWRVDPAAAAAVGLADDGAARAHLLHYCRTLAAGGRYQLLVWPYHAMLGGIGHALVPAIEEAIFFHAIARRSPVRLLVKGQNPLTESYSALGAEVATGADGRPLAGPPTGVAEEVIDELLACDALIVAGQAKSHCVAWTVESLLEAIGRRDPALASRLYLLVDATSPVVIPGAVDFTTEADAAFERFAAAGAHLVRTSEAIAGWPGWPVSGGLAESGAEEAAS